VLRDGGRGGRGRGRARHHHVDLPDEALGERRRRQPAQVLGVGHMPVHYAPASGTLSGIWLLVAIPLASAAILLLLGRRADRWGHWLGVGSIGVSFILGLVYFFALRGVAGPYRAAEL